MWEHMEIHGHTLQKQVEGHHSEKHWNSHISLKSSLESSEYLSKKSSESEKKLQSITG